MTSPILGARIYGSTGSAVAGRFIGGKTFEQIGDAQTLESALVDGLRPGNDVVDFRGEVYWWLGNTIYRLDAATDLWTTTGGHVFVAPPLGTGNNAHGGLLKTLTSSGEQLVGVYRVSGNFLAAIRFDGTTFTETLSTLGIGNVPAFPQETIFNNQLFAILAQNDDIAIYNPESDSLSIVDMPNASATSPADTVRGMCGLSGGLYVMGMTLSPINSIAIWQFLGGGFAELVALNGNTGPGAVAKSTMFPDVALGSLICIHFDDQGTPEGLSVDQVDLTGGSPVITDRTAAMLPAFWQAGSDPGANVRAYSYVDPNPADPTSPETYVLLGASRAGARQLYRYVNPTTVLTDLGPSDVTGEHAIPRRKDACGDYIFTPRTGGVDQDGISIESFARADGGVLVSFRGFRNAGAADRTVTFYYRTGFNTPALLATLVASSVTGGVATNTTGAVSAVDADDSILYTVIWDSFANGVPSGTQFGMEARIVRP